MTNGLRNTWGFTLILLGVVAMPIPIIPGIPLIAAGAAVLGPNHSTVRYCRSWLQARGIWRDQWNGPKV